MVARILRPGDAGNAVTRMHAVVTALQDAHALIADPVFGDELFTYRGNPQRMRAAMYHSSSRQAEVAGRLIAAVQACERIDRQQLPRCGSALRAAEDIAGALGREPIARPRDKAVVKERLRALDDLHALRSAVVREVESKFLPRPARIPDDYIRLVDATKKYERSKSTLHGWVTRKEVRGLTDEDSGCLWLHVPSLEDRLARSKRRPRNRR